MAGRRIGLCCGAPRAPRQVKGRSVAVTRTCCRRLHFDLSDKRKTVRARCPDLHRQDVATLRSVPAADFHFPLNQHTATVKTRTPSTDARWFIAMVRIAAVSGDSRSVDQGSRTAPSVRAWLAARCVGWVEEQ